MDWELHHNKDWGSTSQVTAGILDDDAIDAFTRGHCHAMAVALHEETGWPLYGIYYEGDEGPPPSGHWDGTYRNTPGHVVVQRPDGRFVDVAGAWSLGEEHLPGWIATTAIPFTLDEVHRLCATSVYRPLELGLPAARTLVAPVLERSAQGWIESDPEVLVEI